jgi:FkbH-like protein
MLILSTFNSEYLKSPLQNLMKEFTTEPVKIQYANTNIVGALIDLQSNLKPLSSLAVLLRLFDLTGKYEGQNIKEKLDENLRLVSAQINTLKKEKELPLIVFLCPSPKNFYDKALFDIEYKFLTILKNNKIHTLTQSDIRKHYLLNEVDNSVEHETHIPYTPEFYAASAILLARRLQVLTRRPYKAIVVDCDNTLWTGVAGDVGTEKVVFADHNIALQEFLINQKESGIILCLCSKNEEQTVLDVFKEREEEMPLKIGDVAKYRINWGAKSINIASLASELNLSLDSFIFIDDSACEIAEVNRQIQGVLCVTMPQSLKEFNHTWVFDINEHLLLTETDRHRSELYKKAETRVALAKEFRDPIEYLRSSELGQSIVISKIESIKDVETIRRASLLSGKTNQFNLSPRAKKFSEREIEEMVTNDEKEVFIGRIRDNFDNDDITAVALCSIDENILKVDGFFVSCRKFDRGVEYELIKYIAEFAEAKLLTHIEIKFKKVINRMAWIFLNVLSEKKTLRNPILNVLFKKDSSLTQAVAQFLYKYLNISLSFDVLATDTVFNVAFSVEKLINLQIDSLIRATLKAKQVQVQAAQEVILNGNDVVSERYLVQLREMTSSLDYLMKKFFIDIDKFKSIDKLEDRVIALCNDLLGEQGQDKSLVSRGLDSLKATQFSAYLYNSHQINIDITKLLCAKMTVINLIKFIKAEKETRKNISETVLMKDSPYGTTTQVSLQQKRLWMAEQKEDIKNSSDYHMTACYTVENLDINRFEIACRQLIDRYDVFGATFFIDKDGQLVQTILPPEKRKLELEVNDLGEGESLESAIKEVIRKPLSMSQHPLIRFILFKDQKNKNYHILFHVHHGIFDAISLKNYLNKLSELYCNPLTPNQSELIEFPPQYISYIHYQQGKLLNNDYIKEGLNFWKKELSKIGTITEFKHDQANVTFKLATERKAERYNFSSTQDDLTALKYLAQSAEVTPYSVISTLFSLLIAAYAYQDNIAIITATNGRSGNSSFHKMIGFFINLLVQCFDLEENKDKTFTEYLKDNHQKWLDAQAFQDIPFEEIQKVLSEQDVKDILLNPALIYQSYDIPELRLDGKSATLSIPEQPIIFDLREFCRFGNFTLFVQDDKDTKKLNFVIEYAKDLYSFQFIERIANNFKHLITKMVNNPEQRLDRISVVCDQEHQELLGFGRGPRLEYPVNNLVEGFKLSVVKYPENISICYNENTFSYDKLDKVSDKLACFLYQQGIRKGDNVGIACPRNHLFFIAELAILKRGAVFVPLSMQDPENRLLYIIKDASLKYIIGDVDLTQVERFKKDKSIDLNFIDIQAVIKQVMAIDFPVLNEQFLPEIGREDRACILYTSGSTGNPKGVILKHKGILRVVESSKFVTVKSSDKIAQMANEAFDAAQLECWLAWNNGASLVIIDKNTMLDPKIFR